jgi:PKD repeat protein
VAEPVEFTLNGPNEGDLVAQGSFTWDLNEVCANPITSTLAEDGVSRNYTAGTPIQDPASYTFTLTVPNCVGDVAQERRAFRVNAPPVAVPVPNGHPNADALAAIPTYVVTEGAPLRVEGDDSLPPEREDSIAAFRWDFDSNGLFDVVGDATTAARVAFPTEEDGAFMAMLEVEDSFGVTHRQDFEVLIEDVHPTANAGGPYSPAQGEAQTFDATLSRAANAADPITEVRWIWGDGSDDTVGAPPEALTPTHIFERDGQYEVRLVVTDEDSARSQVVQVSVRDVPPAFAPNGVTFAPEQPYELQDVTFTVDAEAGAPGDPLISFDFDFLGNGQVQQYPMSEVTYQYLEAGDFTVEVKVRDEDSLARLSFPISVRPITLSDLFNEISAAVARIEQDGGPERALSALNPAEQRTALEWVEQGLWLEAQRNAVSSEDASHEARLKSMYRGASMMAFDELLFRLNRAQNAGATFGNLLWKISRQLLRETEAYADEVLASDANALLAPSYQQAELYLSAARELFENVDFADRVEGRDGFLARDLFAAVYEAHFSLRNYSDLATVYQGFPMPTQGDSITRIYQANEPAGHVKEAFDQLHTELTAYLDVASVEADPGPGVAEVQSALTTLEQLREWAAEPVGSPCLTRPEFDPEDPECATIDDVDALHLQLGLMDLISDLFAAADQGVYVRSAQNMLTLAVRFRVEVALLSVEDECGIRSPLLVSARAQQEVMLNLLERGQNDAALLYYIAPERRCLVTRIFNECVVPARNVGALPEDLLEPEPYPAECEQVGFGDNENVAVVVFEPPIPLRAPFVSLDMLYKILTAFIQNIDLANPAELSRFAPEYTWDELNRFSIDNAFTIDDVNTAIQQFNHDRFDYDEDGLIGLIEIDCRVRYNVPLSPTNPSSTGVPDGEIDCDGDLIPNAEEVALGLNPVEPADAELDTDLDGVNNYLEWFWAKQGLELDLRDPLDVLRDQDGDGINNRLEILNGLDPLRSQDALADPDGDGLTNAQEVLNGLDPRDGTDADADPDGDGLTSREEILRGRNPLVADCESDAIELLGRDDTPESARALMFEGTPESATFTEGTICGAPGSEDVDWFVVDVQEEQMRLVAHLRGAEVPNTALSLRLYRRSDLAQIATSSTLYETEVVVASRGQLEAGEYLLRVSHDDRDQAPESPYTLDVTLIEASTPCLPDLFEGAGGNDRLSSATPLGASELRRGDVWVCEAERNTGDWFRLEMGDIDRTVHISYAPNTDGKLELAVMTQDLGAYVESADIQKSAQCINVRASGSADFAFVNVTAASIFSDGDARVDYVIQVIDTDLDANPRGACDELNRGLFDFHPWPTLEMP